MTDHICKSASQVAEQVSMGLERKKRLWDSISEKLADLDKKVLSWFLVMATSLSLVVAGGIEYLIKESPVKDDYVTPPMAPESKQANITSQSNASIHGIAELKSKPVPRQELIKPKTELTPIQLSSLPNEKIDAAEKPKMTPEIFGGVSVSKQGFAPEFGLSLPIIHKTIGQQQHAFGLGISTQLHMNNTKRTEATASSQLKVSPVVYGNLTYEVKKSNGAPNWNMRMGYQLNETNDSSLWNGRSIKASIHKSINDHIRIGPEIIMSDDFKRVYPGIALIVS